MFSQTPSEFKRTGPFYSNNQSEHSQTAWTDSSGKKVNNISSSLNYTSQSQSSRLAIHQSDQDYSDLGGSPKGNGVSGQQVRTNILQTGFAKQLSRPTAMNSLQTTNDFQNSNQGIYMRTGESRYTTEGSEPSSVQRVIQRRHL